ncbi:unnamed protein product [Effrenium voratum]|nr:unnamed protein product [Effrenium voratum]
MDRITAAYGNLRLPWMDADTETEEAHVDEPTTVLSIRSKDSRIEKLQEELLKQKEYRKQDSKETLQREQAMNMKLAILQKKLEELEGKGGKGEEDKCSLASWMPVDEAGGRAGEGGA